MQGTNPITMLCTYVTPCGWCTKWDKKCDRKIGCNKNSDLDDIRSGKGLSRLDAALDPNKPLPPGIRKEIRG